MISPDHVWLIPNLSVRIFGIIVSYACQNVQIRKNANPTHTVRFVFSFIAYLLVFTK